ncbi:E3 ubiquitin-protein ligase TRIM39 isoform X2 [Amia ocellicauda]|uniref:E3 ubiquitin-protein ligase TRIM39 isoform X2 n=1 Tax=Amia ocellicauda TaxID=2972642 RepID=UPI003464C3D6
MTSPSSILSEEEFQCSICLDIFTRPVSTPCGHNFCMECIEGYWDSTAVCQCPLCKETFHRRPVLRVNTFIAGMAEQLKKMSLSPPEERSTQPGEVPCDFCTGRKLRAVKSCLAQLRETEAEVQQKIQDRLKKLEEIRQVVELSRLGAQREAEDSEQVFRALVCSIVRSQAELLELIEEKHRVVARRAEGLIEQLEQEITELEKRRTELEQLSHTEDHIYFLQSLPALRSPSPSKDWADVTVTSDLSLENLRSVVSKLEATLREELNSLHGIELKRIQQCAVDVTLDPNTAHPLLILSEDGKQVRMGNKRQAIPDNPERFNHVVNVLGKENFSSGRHYWEVEVGEKIEWDLGVARESINRKGAITLSHERGYWSLVLRNGDEYWANANPPVLLPLSLKPQKVGVFVDYDGGQVSFYNVEARSHIYTFTDTFTEKLYPYFSPYCNVGFKNTAPLIISPVRHCYIPILL